MALGKRLINTGGEAACLTETTDIFGDGNGKALYSLDFDASSQDGLLNATPTNVDFGVSGKTVNGARFNGSNSKITRENIFDNTQVKMSASVWVRATDYSPSGNINILDIGDNDTAVAQNRIFISGTSPHKIFVTINGAIGGFAEASQSFTDNSWNHIVATWDVTGGGVTNGIKIYLNGSLAAQGNSTQGFNSARDLALGVNEDQSVGDRHHFSGTLDQVRIFSTELSLSQVQTLYNSGNGETACVHTSTTDDNDFPVTNVAYYKLDNSAEDSKGTNHLTENNIEYRFGKYGQAAVFNGTNSYLYADNSVQQPTTNFSVSIWTKLDSTIGGGSNGAIGFIGNFKSGVTPQVGFAIAKAHNEDEFSFWADGTANSKGGKVVGTTDIQTGIWYHVVGTYDGTNVKIYVNGSLENSVAYSSTPLATDQPLVLGRWYGNFDDYYLNGQIDQVRIFSTALDANKVSQLYNEKPETDTSDFKTVLYEGTSANQYISNVGMDLETSGGLVWIKNRDVTDHHVLFDSVRGETKYIMSSFPNSQETTDSATLTSFEKNGFFLGADGTTGGAANGNNESLVAWCWKGGNAPVTNTNGANIDSSVSANTAAGFSIVTYTGTGNGNVTSDTVGHGLSSTPDIVMIKRRNGNDNWQIQANIDGTYKSGGFSTGAFSVASPTPVADPTSTVFNPFFSNTTGTYVAYCWHSVAGYSKIGTYTGDGTSSGTTINVGFKPSFLLVKNADDTGSWHIFDSRRNPSNPVTLFIKPNQNVAEGNSNSFNFHNNGFEPLATYVNQLNDTFLYMAFK